MGPSRPRNSTRAGRARSVKSVPKPRRKPPAPPKRSKLGLGTTTNAPGEARAEAILKAARATKPARAGDQPYISPTQAVREMRDGVPATELREIHDQLDVALSVVSLCAAVLQVQMADYDADVAASLKHCVGDILDTQMERITTLIEGGAA